MLRGSKPSLSDARETRFQLPIAEMRRSLHVHLAKPVVLVSITTAARLECGETAGLNTRWKFNLSVERQFLTRPLRCIAVLLQYPHLSTPVATGFGAEGQWERLNLRSIDTDPTPHLTALSPKLTSIPPLVPSLPALYFIFQICFVVPPGVRPSHYRYRRQKVPALEGTTSAVTPACFLF